MRQIGGRQRVKRITAWALTLAMVISGAGTFAFGATEEKTLSAAELAALTGQTEQTGGTERIGQTEPVLSAGSGYEIDLSEAPGLKELVGAVSAVPFTYVGEIDGYTYAEETAAKAGQGQTGTRELLVSDTNLTAMSWDSLNRAGLIYGDYANPITITLDGWRYKAVVRALTAGREAQLRAQDGLENGEGIENNHGIPEGNEWDAIVSKSVAEGAGTGNEKGYVKNWDGQVSFTQDLHQSGNAVVRGLAARGWNRCGTDFEAGNYGYRPAVELLESVGPADGTELLPEQTTEGALEEMPGSDLPISAATGDIVTYTIPSGQNNAGKNLYFDTKSDGTLELRNTSSGSGVSFDSEYKEYTGSITIPSTVNGAAVTRLVGSAFYGCSGLTSITIPEGVTFIGGAAFEGCSGLTDITLPNKLKNLGNYAFADCYGLTSITIPQGVTSIGNYAFSGCSGLANIYVHNNSQLTEETAKSTAPNAKVSRYLNVTYALANGETQTDATPLEQMITSAAFDVQATTDTTTEPVVKKTGYTFKSWSSKKDSSGNLIKTATWRTNLTSVTISGSATVGATLNAGLASVGETATYQWYRNNSNSNTGGTKIDQATAKTYILTNADAGKFIYVVATGVENYAETVTSSPTAAIAAIVPKSPIALSTTNVSDNSVSLSWAAPSDTGGANITGYMVYYHKRGESGEKTLSSTSTTCSIPSLERNQAYLFSVAAVNSAGTGERTAEMEVTTGKTAIDGGISLNVTSPVNPGATIQAMVIMSVGKDGEDVTYQWYRDDQTISGATTKSYTVTPEDIGKQLCFKVIAKEEKGYTGTLVSDPIEVEGIAITGNVTITSGAIEKLDIGNTLTAQVAKIEPAEAQGTLQYQWLRDEKAIAGATGVAYVLATADINHGIKLKVTGTGKYVGDLVSNTIDFGAITLQAAITSVKSADQSNTISWTAPAYENPENAASGYYLYYTTDQELGTTTAALTVEEAAAKGFVKVTDTAIAAGEGTMTYEHTGLANETPYFYRLAAENRYGIGLLSEGVSGTPMPGVEVSGTVELTAGDVSKATVILTTAKIDGVVGAYGYVAGENDYVAQVGADGSWRLDVVPQGTYTMLIRKPGALYYQKNDFVVGTEAIGYKLVTLPVGDLDLDGTVEFSDLMLLIGERNYGKSISDNDVLTIADLDEDATIAFSDLMLLIGDRNYTMVAHIE